MTVSLLVIKNKRYYMESNRIVKYLDSTPYDIIGIMLQKLFKQEESTSLYVATSLSPDFKFSGHHARYHLSYIINKQKIEVTSHLGMDLISDVNDPIFFSKLQYLYLAKFN